MYVVLIMIAVVATFFGVGTLVHRRRHRRIREMIAAMGGEVVAMVFTPFPSAGTRVDYIGPQGELRRAVVLNGRTEFCEDRPFELVLSEKYKRDPSEMLSAVMLAASYSKLPGYEDYKALILELAAGPAESVTIDEAASDASAERRFAPMVQCFEAVSIGSKSAAKHLLNLVVDGKNLDVEWSVQGLAPNRSFVVKAVRPPHRAGVASAVD